MRYITILLFVVALNATAETINGVHIIDENTDTAEIHGGLFGTPQASRDDGWESKGLTAADESKGIDKIVPDAIGALIQFAYDSAHIEGESSYKTLAKLAQALQNPPSGATVQITGHADCLGTQGYNAGLALERAQAVKEFLSATYHLPKDLLSVTAQGEAAPLQGTTPTDDTDSACRLVQSDADRALNRRVEFRALAR